MKAGLNFFASDQLNPLHKSANVEVGASIVRWNLFGKLRCYDNASGLARPRSPANRN